MRQTKGSIGERDELVEKWENEELDKLFARWDHESEEKKAALAWVKNVVRGGQDKTAPVTA